MCGIAGIISFNAQVRQSDIKVMTDLIEHRGPDGEGHWVNKSGNVGLGHRRLSIIDISEKASQPMHYHENRYTITYNGEIYNYLELRKSLLEKGYSFKSDSDTEVLLALYKDKGKDCLQDLDGMFAFAIWDDLEQTMFCARDRMGEKPFYFYKDDQQLFFASEMKAIFPLTKSKQVNKTMLGNFLANDLVTNPSNDKATFFKNILKLPKASWMSISAKGEIQQQKYWYINTDTNRDLSLDEASGELINLLKQSVKRRLRSDVKIGSSLSGGLDSSVIVSLIQKELNFQTGQNENITFSARFKEAAFNEGKYIDLVCDALKLTNFSCYPDETLISQEIEKVFYHQEEPFQTASILNQWKVMELAKNNNVTVLLDGQGADEILAGYPWYSAVFQQELFKQNKSDYKKEIEKAKNENFPVADSNFLFKFKSKNHRLYSKLRMHQQYLLKKSDLQMELHADLRVKSREIPFITPYPPNLNQTLKLDLQENILESLLRFSDRNAMAFSREVRLPYTDHKLIEFVMSLPSSMKISGGWTKYILRKSFDKVLPKEITWRKDKMGYAAPQKKWLNDSLNKELINDANSYLIKNQIINTKSNFKDQDPWKLLMIYLLFKS